MSQNIGQRNIPDTETVNKCYAVDATLNLLVHTLRNCKNRNIFTEEYKETVTDKLTGIASDIYLSAYTANKIRVGNDEGKRNKRRELQNHSIDKCNEFLAMINVARRICHLRKGKTEYWVKMTVNTRNLLAKWRDSA